EIIWLPRSLGGTLLPALRLLSFWRATMSVLRHSERGTTLVLTAVFIVVLMTMAALAIDLGIGYTARTSAQTTADAAAIAGAYTFLNPTYSQPTAAQQGAIRLAAQNKILGQPVTISAADVGVDVANQRVT